MLGEDSELIQPIGKRNKSADTLAGFKISNEVQKISFNS